MTLARVVSSRLAPALVIAAGVALRLPALAIERVADDWYQLSMVEGSYPVRRAPWDLYDFIRATPAEHSALLGRGTFPWWTAPDLHIAAWRPLSSLTLSLDHALFGRGTVGPHAHSLAWLGALLAASWWWMRAVLPRAYALAALSLLAVSATLTVPTAWLANRPSLLSGVFGLLAMGLLARRDSPSIRRAIALGALTTASVCAGEYGLAFAASAVVYELIAGDGTLASRARSTSPVVAVCAVFFVVWRGLGHGVQGTLTYLDPLTHPVAWLAVSWMRGAALLGELVTTRRMTESLATLRGPGLIFLALGLFASLAVTRRADARDRRVAVGIALASLASLVPVLSAPPSERLLIVAAPTFCALVVALLRCASNPSGERRRSLTVALRAVLLGAALAHLVVPLARSWEGVRSPIWWRVGGVGFRSLPGVDACRARDQDHVLLSAASFGVVHVLPLLWQGRGCEAPRTWRVLTVPGAPIAAVRTGERELTAVAFAGTLLGGVARLWHPAPFQRGDRVRLDGFDATVREVSGDEVRRVSFAFDRSLDDPRVVLWQSTPDGYEQVRMPALNGGRVVPMPSPVPE